jgi:hypothetical protein
MCYLKYGPRQNAEFGAVALEAIVAETDYHGAILQF